VIGRDLGSKLLKTSRGEPRLKNIVDELL